MFSGGFRKGALGANGLTVKAKFGKDPYGNDERRLTWIPYW